MCMHAGTHTCTHTQPCTEEHSSLQVQCQELAPLNCSPCGPHGHTHQGENPLGKGSQTSLARPQHRAKSTGQVAGVVFGFQHKPNCTEAKRKKENKNTGWPGGRGWRKQQNSDQARPKCRGWLAGAAWLGSSNRFTDMTSVAPVQIFLW